MTVPRHPDELVRAFLQDGVDELPNRTYDAVRAHIERTRQRAVLGPWREPSMSSVVRIGLAAAAVAIAVVAGLTFLPKTGGSGGLATPRPSPVSMPEGNLAAGDYFINPLGPPDTSIRFTMTVPDGWQSLGEPGKTPTGIAPLGRYTGPDGLQIGVLTITSLEGDPCRSTSDTDIVVGPSVDDLANALVAHDGYEASTPTGVSLGGFNGKRVELQLPATDPTTCAEGQYWVWASGAGHQISSQGPSGRYSLWILDVQGHRVVVMTHHFPGTAAADKLAMDQVVSSVRIAVVP